MTGDKQHDATTEFNEALAAGFAAGNFEALGPFYTEDASLLPPRGKFLDGRASAAAFWLGVANRFKSVVFTTMALKDLGDAARRETGTYAMGGADGQAVEGKYVFVWQLVEGEWQIESAIWNRNGEPGGGGRQGRGQGQQGQGQGQRRQEGGQGAGSGEGYRRGGQGGRGGGAGQGGAVGGYRQGGGRPSFQGGGGGAGGPRQGGGHGGGGGQGGGGQGGGYGGGGGSLYDGNAGLYSNPKE